MFLINTQKNVDNYYRLRYLRHRQTPYNHIRVKAHAIGVSICFYSWLLLNIGDISGNKNLSGRFVCIFSLFCYIGTAILDVIAAKIQ